MRSNSSTLISKISNIIRSYPLHLIYILSFSYQLYWLRMCGFSALIHFDSPTYIKAAEVLLSGDIDVMRTPSYPLLIALCQLLSHSYATILIVCLQIIVFYISVYCCYKTLRNLNVANNISYLATLIYGLYPSILFANVNILTESLATSCSVLLVYCFVKWIQQADCRNVIALMLCVVFLTFIRPSLLYITIAIAIIAVLYFAARNYKRGLQLFSIICVTIFALFGYCKQMEHKTGLFTLSTIAYVNEFDIAYHNGFLKVENVSDPLIKSEINNFEKTEHGNTAFDVPHLEGCTIQQVAHELKLLKSVNPVIWYLKIFRTNFQESLYSSPFGEYHENFHLVYVLLLFAGCFILYYWSHTHKCPKVALFFWLLCMGNIMVNLLGAWGDWTRLFLPSTPILIMLMATMCNVFQLRRTDLIIP